MTHRYLLTMVGAAAAGLLAACGSQAGDAGNAQANVAEQALATGDGLDLSPILIFEDPANCTAGPALASIFEELLKLPRDGAQPTPRPLTIPGVKGTFLPSVLRHSRQGSTQPVETAISLAGHWHGLQVTGLSVSAVPESDVISQQIRFASPAAEVRATLNRQGFNLPPVGEWRETHAGSETPGAIGIEAVGSGTILNCQ